MKTFLQKNLNVNTALITLLGVIMTFALKRVDTALTTLASTVQQVHDIEMRVSNLERWKEKVLEFDGISPQHLMSPKDKP